MHTNSMFSSESEKAVVIAKAQGAEWRVALVPTEAGADLYIKISVKGAL